MRKISANLILPVSSAPLRNGIILVNPDGSIADLIDTGGKLREESGLEYYSGTIIPGLIIPWLRFDEIYEWPPQKHPDDPSGNSDRTDAANLPHKPDPSNNSDRTDAANLSNKPDPSNSYPGDATNLSIKPDPSNSGLAHASYLLKILDRELYSNGIKGVGLVLSETMVSNEGFKQMNKSSLCYHPVIELCPARTDDEFEVFNRGIELVSQAWNEFNLSCSLTACSPAMKYSDIGKLLTEYSRSHLNILPPKGAKPTTMLSAELMNSQIANSTISEPIDTLQPTDSKYPQTSYENRFQLLKNALQLFPEMSFEELLSEFTLKAAAKIFEDDELGSIEKGKKPGLNLVSGYAKGDSDPASKISLKVLV